MSISYRTPASFRDATFIWASWTALSAIGLAIGYALAQIGDSNLLLLIIMPGIPFSALQWLFLQSVPATRSWFLATAITFPLVAFGLLSLIVSLTSVTQEPSGLFNSLTLAFMASSLTIPLPIAQWLVLRRAFHRAAAWIPASCAGWLIGFAIVPFFPPSSLTAVGGVLGALQGAAAGVALVSLKPRTSMESTGA